MICLTETWLNDSISDGEVVDERYFVIRKDRDLLLTNVNDGGGSLIAIKKSFIINKIDNLNNVFDDIWLKITLPNGKILIVCLVYFPSNRVSYDTYKLFCDHLTNFIFNSPDNYSFLVLGDFNLSCITWLHNADGLFPSCFEGRTACYVAETIMLTKLNQHNHIINCTNSILDLVLSDLSSRTIEVTSSSDPLSKVDNYHPPIIINLLSFSQKKLSYNRLPSTNLKNLDYSSIGDHLLACDWVNTITNCDVESAVNVLYTLLNRFLQPKQCIVKSASKFPSWYSLKLRYLIGQKFKYHSLYRTYKKQIDYNIFSNYRKLVKHEICNCYSKYLNVMEVNIRHNPKKFWSFSHSLTSKSGYPSSMHFGTIESHRSTEICNLFADYFQSIYTPNTTSTRYSSITTSPDQFNTYFTEDDVLTVTNSLDINKGSGPDCITNYFIFHLREQLAKPLSIIFNKSLNSGIYPSRWKSAFLVPIFKKGDKSNIANYRPISLLNAFSKIFEKLVYNLIFLEVKNLISVSQHGFYVKRSVLTNLLEFSSYLFDKVDKSQQVDCIYTDFQKAFDTVSHDILIDKCRRIGLSDKLCKWLFSYLDSRSVNVKFNGHISKPFVITSGVPQGSTLGPLLFIIFVNDLSDILKCPHLFYADDLKIFKGVGGSADCLALQEDLDNLQFWCAQNSLKLNLEKCQVISFTRKLHPLFYGYSIANVNLNRVYQIVDLGVTFDSKLTFDLHIDSICSKAHKILGYIFRRGKEFRDPKVFILLFNCLVRSVLEYASQIWNPFYNTYSDRVERVQRKFTRFLVFKSIPHVGHIPYATRLGIFGLLSLDNRRLALDELLLYKMLNFMLETVSLSSINLYAPAYMTRANQLFQANHSRTNLGLSNPLTRLQLSHNEVFLALDLFALSFTQVKSRIYSMLVD